MCVKREPMAMRRSMRACAVRARARAPVARHIPLFRTILRGDVHARRAYPGSRPHFFRSRILELPPRFPTATAGTPRAEAAKIKLFAGSAGAVWA